MTVLLALLCVCVCVCVCLCVCVWVCVCVCVCVCVGVCVYHCGGNLLMISRLWFMWSAAVYEVRFFGDFGCGL